MRDIEVMRRSRKGEIVIPARLAKAFTRDVDIVALKDGKRIIIEEAQNLAQLEEDLEFARRTEEAWKRYENGEFKSLPFDEFLEEMIRW